MIGNPANARVFAHPLCFGAARVSKRVSRNNFRRYST